MTDKVSLPLYSPSQISTWLECNRKWGWQVIDKIRKIDGPAAALGSAVHKCLEEHLEFGTIDHTTNPRAATLAVAAVPYLPPPKTEGLQVELKWKAPLSDSPHMWNGRIDWIRRTPDGQITIGDHKTTSSIEKWGKTETDLLNDVQAVVYGRWAMLEYRVPKVTLQWTYIQTQGQTKVKPVTLELNLKHVEERFSEIDRVALDINKARNVKTALELPYNPGACEMYGGCPYQGNCNLTPKERLRSIFGKPRTTEEIAHMAEGSTSLFDQLSGNTASSTPPAEEAPKKHSGLSALITRNADGKVTHDLQGRALPPNVVSSQMVRVPGSSPAAYRQIDPISPETAEYLAAAALAFWTQCQSVDELPGINPPESKLPPPPVEVEAETTGPVDPVPATAKKRGRPKKVVADTIPAPAPVSAPVIAETIPAPPPVMSTHEVMTYAPEPKTEEVISEVVPDISQAMALFINCRPVNFNGVVEFSEILEAARLRMLVEDEILDYTLVDFGKGSGILACYVEEIVKERISQGAFSLCVDSSYREWSIVQSRLLALAKTGFVVRGA